MPTRGFRRSLGTGKSLSFVGARRGPMGFAEPWLLLGATPVNGGSSPGRPGHPQTGGGAKGRPNQNRGFSPVAVLGSIPLHHRLPKAARYLKWLVLPKHVIAGACQLVRQRDRKSVV